MSFKAKVVLAAVRGDRTVAEPVEQFDVDPKQVPEWKKKLFATAEEIFRIVCWA